MKGLLAAAGLGLLLAVQRGALAGLGPALLLVLLAAVAVWALGGRSTAGGRAAEGHYHGGDATKVRLHEGAHLAAARRTGAPVARTRLGHAPMVRLAKPEAMSARDYMAFMMAGEAATGGEGTSHDRAMVRAEQARLRSRGVPEAEIARTVRAARADARGHARHAERWAKKL